MTLQAWTSGGDLIFDADTMSSGVCLGVFDIIAGNSFTATFPGYTGSTLRVIDCNAFFTGSYTIDNDLGYPRVTSAATGYDRISISVWAMNRPSFSPGPGIIAVTSDQTSLVLSPGGTGLYYLGDATLVSTTPNSGSTGSNGSMGYSTFQITSSVPILPVVYVESGIFSHLMQVTKLSSTVYEIRARAAINGSTDGTGFNTLTTPRVLCYAQKSAPAGPPYFYILRTDGTLAWDLMAGRNRLLGAMYTANLNATDVSQVFPLPGFSGEAWAALGDYAGWRITSTAVGGGNYRVTQFDRFFFRSGSDFQSVEVRTNVTTSDFQSNFDLRRARSVFVVRRTGL